LGFSEDLAFCGAVAAANTLSIGEDAVPLYKNFNILHLNLRLQFVSIFDGYQKKTGTES
jgi:hypothetical protein